MRNFFAPTKSMAIIIVLYTRKIIYLYFTYIKIQRQRYVELFTLTNYLFTHQ